MVNSSDRQWRDDCRVFWKINLSVVDRINWNEKSREAAKDSYKPILKALNNFSEASHKATHRRDMLSFADISSLLPKENNTPEYPASFKTANLVLFGMLSLFFFFFFDDTIGSSIRTKASVARHSHSHALSFLNCVVSVTLKKSAWRAARSGLRLRHCGPLVGLQRFPVTIRLVENKCKQNNKS